MHAPSIAHAAAAAVLRSGHLADAATARGRSRSTSRPRACASRESLLDGVRQGQPLGALLGYRFERGLHERGLDRFMPGFRRDVAACPVYEAQERLEFVTAWPASARPSSRR